MLRVMLVLLVLAAGFAPLAAQQPQQRPAAPRPTAQPAAPAPTPPPAPEPAPTAYEPDLLKMSEVMGALAFLRELCQNADGPAWRQKMTELLAAEGTTQGRRERLAGAYNTGFRSYALTYRQCTAAAEEAAGRLAADGERLSRLLAGRFGG
jgi:uncharacterized protein (TIGR02301 family)